jgi:hypothetical protein
MIIVYSLLFLLVPIALGVLLWQSFRLEKRLNAEKDVRLLQLRQLARQLRAQRQEIEQLHADVSRFQLPLPTGKAWWLLNALFKALKISQLRKIPAINVSPTSTGLKHTLLTP